MSAPVFQKAFTQDIRQKVEARHCGGLMFTGDSLSDTISVSLYDGGEAYAVSGTVTCNVIRADGATVPVVGSSSGNTVSATLTEVCFAIPGPLVVIMKIASGDTTTTVLKAVFTVDAGETGTIVDPGTIIQDVTALISAIETAVASIPADYSDLLAAIAPDFSSLTAYTAGQYAWYNGTLYMFTSAHAAGSWTGTDAAAAVVGNDVAELKSAVNELLITEETETPTITHENGYVKSDGTIGASDSGSTWQCSEYVDVSNAKNHAVTVKSCIYGAASTVWLYKRRKCF